MTTAPSDPLKLAELFQHGGEPWQPLLTPVIEALPNAAAFIGPARDRTIVPLRELTFQALKPNPPERWKVVIFGQSPYPRVESATGIAMFDNAFHAWREPGFQRCASMRNMLKSALIWKHGVPETLAQKEIAPLLDKHHVAPPTEWFQALLSQGVLLVDASLTRHTNDAVPVAQHVEFWAPVAEAILRAILDAKREAPPEHRGVVFAWWGAHAKGLRARVDAMAKTRPSVLVRHIDHWHPAARDNRFNEGGHYQKVNDALTAMGATPVDWLPTQGWRATLAAPEETAARMGAFLQDTMELHKLYLERLQGVGDEKLESLSAIRDIAALERPDFTRSVAPVRGVLGDIRYAVEASQKFARQVQAATRAGLDADEIAALYLYTTGSSFYRQLNAALRDPDRAKAQPYHLYLRLFLDALGKLPRREEPLYRGVHADLTKQYPKGSTVTWWGVSSCTPKLSVAQGFLGGRGMLFEVKPRSAVSIMSFSAFKGEEEYVLAPGTQLKVLDITTAKGFTTVRLEEVGERLVA